MENITLKGTENFAHDKMQITLSQAEMAKAVEWWLNNVVMKVTVQVISITDTVTHKNATFHIIVEEKSK